VAGCVLAVWGIPASGLFKGGQVVAAIFLWLGVGLLMGALQWSVLRRLVSGLDGWIVVSTAGWVAGLGSLSGIFGLSVGLLGEESGGGLAVGAVAAGAVLGAAQWLVLRRCFPWAGWWIPASTLGTAACVLLFVTLSRGADAGLVGLSGIAASGAAGGAAYGLITGGALVRLLRRRRIGYTISGPARPPGG
jgi:hypothetical protein